jgi:hypothetical protein
LIEKSAEKTPNMVDEYISYLKRSNAEEANSSMNGLDDDSTLKLITSIREMSPTPNINFEYQSSTTPNK